MSKEWIKIERYPDYEITCDCEIRSCKSGRGAHLNPTPVYNHKNDEMRVRLRNKMGKQESVSMLRLMAETFHGGPHDDCDVVQLDGDFYNFKADNIAWKKKDNYIPQDHKTQCIRVVETGETFDSIYDCSEKLGCSVMAIKRCLKDSYLLVRGNYHLELIDI